MAGQDYTRLAIIFKTRNFVGTSTKVVLITGASSGFGRGIATALAAKNYRVFGTTRTGSAGESAGFTTLALDVTQDASVAACITEAATSRRIKTYRE
jgi:NADP-dependent 3-hydroxy acid dehydrogenase YdfG